MPELPPKGSGGARLGNYRFWTADCKIDLELRPDHTYYTSMEAWARTGQENGAWSFIDERIVLRPEGAGLGLPIHRLLPDHENNADILRVVDPEAPANRVARAITFGKQLTQ